MNYSEALKNLEEVRALLQQAQDKIEALEAELVVEKTVVAVAEALVKKKDVEIQVSERALRDQSSTKFGGLICINRKAAGEMRRNGGSGGQNCCSGKGKLICSL